MDFSKTWASVALALVVLFSGIAFAGGDVTPPTGASIVINGGNPFTMDPLVSADIVLSTDDVGIELCSVDWGDGTPEEIIPSDGTYTHDFVVEGQYEINFVCFDTSFNSDGDSTGILIDSTPPSGAAVSVPGGLYSNSLTVSADFTRATDNVLIQGCSADWGDGSLEESIPVDGSYNHVYPSDGQYEINFVCFDYLGFSNSANPSPNVIVDTAEPTGQTIELDGGNPVNNTGLVIATVYSGTDGSGSGLYYCQYNVDDSGWVNLDIGDTEFNFIASNGIHSAQYRCLDGVENVSEIVSDDILVQTDANPPVGQSIVLDEGAEYNTTGLVTAALNPGTDDTEIFYCQVSTDDGDSWTNTASDDTEFGAILPDGMQSFLYRCVDVFDNVSEIVSDSIVVDTTTPESWAFFSDSPFYTNVNPFTIEVVAYDVTSGLDGENPVQLWFRKDGGEWQNSGLLPDESLLRSGPTHTFSFEADGDGVYDFYTISTDNAGNVEEPPFGKPFGLGEGEPLFIVPDATAIVDTVAPVLTAEPSVRVTTDGTVVPFLTAVLDENPTDPVWTIEGGFCKGPCAVYLGYDVNALFDYGNGIFTVTLSETDLAGNEATPKVFRVIVGSQDYVFADAPDVTLNFGELPAGESHSLTVMQSDGPSNGTTGFLIGGQFFDIESSLVNGTFEVTLTFNYADEDDDGVVDGTSINEADLKVYYWDGSQWTEAGESVIDALNNTISVTVDHFTQFGLLKSNPPAPQPPQGGGGGGSLGGGTFYTPTGGATATTTTPADETTQAIDSPVPAPVNRSPYVVSTTPAPAPVPVAPPAIVPAPAPVPQAAPTPTAPTGFFGLGATNGNIVLVVLVVLGLFSFQRFYSLKMKKTQ